MKIQLKLIGFIVVAVIIPIIILNLIAGNVMLSTSMNTQIDSIERSVKNQADDLNYVLEDMISTLKDFTSLSTVCDYTILTNTDEFSFDAENELYKELDMEIHSLHSYSNSLKKAMVINNSGIVISSTDSEDVSRRLSNYKELFAMALENNGFSSFFMNTDNTPVFILTKSVYSEAHERIGIAYVLYDTGYIQKYLNSTKLDQYTSVAVMDKAGNILEYPYKTVKSYTENPTYSMITEQLKQILTVEDCAVYRNIMTNSGSGGKITMFYNSEVSNSGWTLLSSTEKKSLENYIKKNSNNLLFVSVMISVCAIIITCIFSARFTRPVSDIIRVFAEKQKGNVNARFNLKANDEFGMIGTAFDSMFNNIFESEQRYRTIVEMTNNIIFEVNFKRSTVFVSKNFNKKFSYRPKDDTLKESFLYNLRIHKDDKKRFTDDIERILGPANFIQGEYRIKSIYGDFAWTMIKATKFYDRDEVPTKIVGVIVDIDREKKSEMHLLQRASYDNLTQLYNRETFLKTLGAELELSTMKKSLDALMFIDLDDFKFFNDEFGHACGDEVLKFVADTLKEISFERGFAGRFGGDEFVVCFTNLTLYGDSGKIAQEIIDVLGKGFISETTGEKLAIKCSIGIAFLRESGRTSQEVIAAADEAMYNIKKHGKSAYAYAKSAQKNGDAAVASSCDIAPSTSAIDSDNRPEDKQNDASSENDAIIFE